MSLIFALTIAEHSAAPESTLSRILEERNVGRAYFHQDPICTTAPAAPNCQMEMGQSEMGICCPFLGSVSPYPAPLCWNCSPIQYL